MPPSQAKQLERQLGSRATVLVCDDEELIRWSLSEHLSGEGYRVVTASDGEEALERVAETSPDMILVDLKMPRMGGMEFLERLRKSGSDIPVVVITAHGAIDSAVEATRLGARDYLNKPFDLREVALIVQRTLEAKRLENEIQYLRSKQSPSYGRIIGDSPAMRKLFSILKRLESVEAPTVLLTGESGTGKDIVAHAIHDLGMRKRGPIMDVDCVSLPEALIESELFGHEKGAFTDAKALKRGQFEVAKGGTIFLDEIGEMPMSMQAKLLRALESRSFKRVGGVTDIRLDAGVIAATNRDLREEIQNGRFREDLFFRLNVINVEIPPLRERREDIPLLASHFVSEFNDSFRREVEGISEEAMGLLQEYRWPGNVRELRNVIERIVILENDDIIRAQHLPPEIRYGEGHRGENHETFVLPEAGVNLDEVEKSLIVQAMERTSSNQSAAARLLGITRYALRYRLEKHGLA